jgi:hypothetical protein
VTSPREFVLRKVQVRVLSFVVVIFLLASIIANGWLALGLVLIGNVLFVWDWRLDVAERRHA